MLENVNKQMGTLYILFLAFMYAKYLFLFQTDLNFNFCFIISTIIFRDLNARDAIDNLIEECIVSLLYLDTIFIIAFGIPVS